MSFRLLDLTGKYIRTLPAPTLFAAGEPVVVEQLGVDISADNYVLPYFSPGIEPTNILIVKQ